MRSRIRGNGRLSWRAWITTLGLVVLLAGGALTYAVLRPIPRPMVIGVHVAFPIVGDDPENLPVFPLLANGNRWDQVIRRLVYSGMFRYGIVDGLRKPVEDLAAGPCTSTHDLLGIRCDIQSARFHDGTPLTADDVAFTYELLASDACRTIFCQTGLEETIAVDRDTVEFRLEQPDATFLTIALADVLIESKQRITDAYDTFRAGAGDTDRTTSPIAPKQSSER